MTIINDSSLSKNYIAIQPLKINFNDVLFANRLYVVSVSDNLLDTALFQYQLYSDSTELYSNIIPMSGDAYSSWNGDNVTPFNYVVNALGLTAI